MRVVSQGAGLAVSAVAVIVISVCPTAARAQIVRDLQFSSSPNPVGSGARAVGRGGAFIAIADDATAASWNPAGLVQLEFPEASAAVSYLGRHEAFDFGGGVVNSEDYDFGVGDLNYFSLAYPTEALPVYMVFSLNYQRLYEFNRAVQYTYSGPRAAGPMFIDSRGDVDFVQRGAFSTITPAVAVEINYRFSLGLAVNLWNDELTPNHWTQTLNYRENGRMTLGPNTYNFTAQTDKDETYALNGPNYNFNLGFLWDINDTWRVAGVYKSEVRARVDHDLKMFTGQFFPAASGLTDFQWTRDSFDETLTLPASYGIGVAFQPSDAWSLALDLYHTEWQYYKLEDEDGNEYNLVKGRVNDSGGVLPTTQVRMGVEYLSLRGRDVFPIRAGFMYDPEPAEGAPRDVWGLSLGGGWARDKILLDAACQLRWSQNAEGEVVAEQESTRDVLEYYFLVSMIYHVGGPKRDPAGPPGR